MRNMTAFFSLGPILLTRDVPKVFDEKKEASAQSWLEVGMQSGDKGVEEEDIKMAVAGTKGEWKWLQPYSVEEATRFMSLSVGQDDGRLRTDPGPYTLVEGFLQLATPIVVPDGERQAA